MLRTSLVLLLFCAAAPAFANRPSGAMAPVNTADADPEGAVAVGAPVEKPKALLPPAAGGADDDDVMLPRARGPKWHRLLPGMFR